MNSPPREKPLPASFFLVDAFSAGLGFRWSALPGTSVPAVIGDRWPAESIGDRCVYLLLTIRNRFLGSCRPRFLIRGLNPFGSLFRQLTLKHRSCEFLFVLPHYMRLCILELLLCSSISVVILVSQTQLVRAVCCFVEGNK